MKKNKSVKLVEGVEKTDMSLMKVDREGKVIITTYSLDKIPNPDSYPFPDYDAAEEKFEFHIRYDESEVDQTDEEGESKVFDFADKVLDIVGKSYISSSPWESEELSSKLQPVKGKKNVYYVKEVFTDEIIVFEFSDGFRRSDLMAIRNNILED